MLAFLIKAHFLFIDTCLSNSWLLSNKQPNLSWVTVGDLRPGAVAQSPGREAALAWASLAQRFPEKALSSRGRGRLRGFLELRRQCGISHEV